MTATRSETWGKWVFEYKMINAKTFCEKLVFTHCHDERWRRPDHRRCCSSWSVEFREHYSAHTVTYPGIWLEIWCAYRFSCGKNCSNEIVWCVNRERLVVDESRNVLLTFVCIYMNCNNIIRFQQALQPRTIKEFANFYGNFWVFCPAGEFLRGKVSNLKNVPRWNLIGNQLCCKRVDRPHRFLCSTFRECQVIDLKMDRAFCFPFRKLDNAPEKSNYQYNVIF